MKFQRCFFAKLLEGISSGLSAVLILLILGLPLIITLIYTIGKNPK